MAEQKAVDTVKKELKKKGREMFNIHGSAYGSKQGKPDIFSTDKNGRFMGIEVKARSGKPYPNQIRRGREIVEFNNGRYVIAYEDFDIEKVDNYEIPRVLYENEDMKFPKVTCELVLDESQVTYNG